MEVTNRLPQSSHDQVWSMRPLALNRDSSATSRMLPQPGHFGRLRFSVAWTRLDEATFAVTWHADWTIIVDSPRRSLTAPRDSQPARCLWRQGDGGVKFSWR